jgi:hypothetical protein
MFGFARALRKTDAPRLVTHANAMPLCPAVPPAAR